jgi:hypothetical protein
MSRKQHECIECDAIFKITHNLDEDYYTVTNCPFCGASIDDNLEDDDDEDMS